MGNRHLRKLPDFNDFRYKVYFHQTLYFNWPTVDRITSFENEAEAQKFIEAEYAKHEEWDTLFTYYIYLDSYQNTGINFTKKTFYHNITKSILNEENLIDFLAKWDKGDNLYYSISGNALLREFDTNLIKEKLILNEDYYKEINSEMYDKLIERL